MPAGSRDIANPNATRKNLSPRLLQLGTRKYSEKMKTEKTKQLA